MGLRGPAPSSGVDFRGAPVVLRGRTPAVRAPKHVLADTRGYVSIHRLIASEARGRWLSRHEGVQLVDGDPWNWSPSNLRVVALSAHLPRGRSPRPSTP
jgi:hypothetical protein